MKSDFYCSHCEISYFVRWNPMDFDDGGHDLLDEEIQNKEESWPMYCPFCASIADEE